MPEVSPETKLGKTPRNFMTAPCPICKARPGQCMGLCDGAGTVDMEKLARILAQEQRSEAWAEGHGRRPDGISPQWWAKNGPHWLEQARSYLATLDEIYSPPVKYTVDQSPDNVVADEESPWDELPTELRDTLLRIWQLDKNTWCILTDHPFTAQEAQQTLAQLNES